MSKNKMRSNEKISTMLFYSGVTTLCVDVFMMPLDNAAWSGLLALSLVIYCIDNKGG